MFNPKFSSPQVTVKGQVKQGQVNRQVMSTTKGQQVMSTSAKGQQVMSTSAKGQQVMSTSGKGTLNKQVNQVPMTFPSFKAISAPKLQVNEVELQVTAMWNKMYPDEQRPKFDPTEFLQMFPGIKSDIAFYKSYYLYLKHKQAGERFLTVDAFIAYT